MRSKIFVLTFFFIALVFSGIVSSADHKFVGVATCKMCHKAPATGDQYSVWAGSKHAKAMETLKTPEALKIAQSKGLKAAPSEAPECTKCHQTAFDAPAAMLDPKFDKNMGVQCESCHGAGGDYKSMATMKDPAKAAAAGLNAIKVADGSAEKLCKTCHNSESPTFKSFDFQKQWEQIKHPLKKA